MTQHRTRGFGSSPLVAPRRRFAAALPWRAPIVAGILALALGSSGCGDPRPASPSVGTNSNWLRACASDDQCGDLPACECGACTSACALDEDCSELEDARCALGADPAAWAECESRQPAIGAGICLPRCVPGSCDDGQACVSGACVLAPLPDVPFCAPARSWDGARRTVEDELIARVQDMRAQGGIVCGSAAASTPAPALRFDVRLVCAARMWALEIERSGAASPTDSEGRTGQDRLLAAGYAARLWGDSYAIDATTADQALELMLADVDSCQRLAGAEFTDFGVASTGSTFVVSIGAE
jgi:hypothetical protein